MSTSDPYYFSSIISGAINSGVPKKVDVSSFKSCNYFENPKSAIFIKLSFTRIF